MHTEFLARNGSKEEWVSLSVIKNVERELVMLFMQAQPEDGFEHGLPLQRLYLSKEEAWNLRERLSEVLREWDAKDDFVGRV